MLHTQRTIGSSSGVYDFNGTANYSRPESTWRTQDNSMISFGHRNYPHAGGPWTATKVEDLRTTPYVDISGFRRRYRGTINLGDAIFDGDQSSLAIPPEMSTSKLNAYGTSAIAAVEPTASEWSLAQALAELKKDGLPKIAGASFKSEVKSRRGLGSEYLNADFGWRPIISDFKSFMKTVQDSDDIIGQYKRDSGQKIRRRAGAPATTGEKLTEGHSFLPRPNPGSTVGWAHGFRHQTTSERLWFSGCFSYYLPDQKEMTAIHEFALKARRLHGVEITPEVIWNVAPWSWAMDWFGNVGDVMHNVSALGRDGLVMRYGYVMHERIRVDRRAATLAATGDPLEMVRTTSHKKRLPATPYGFGLSWDGFSPKQLATIAALGMSIPR